MDFRFSILIIIIYNITVLQPQSIRDFFEWLYGWSIKKPSLNMYNGISEAVKQGLFTLAKYVRFPLNAGHLLLLIGFHCVFQSLFVLSFSIL